MATFTHRVTTPDTGNLPNTSGATTPAVGDLVVVFCTIEGSTADHTLSGTGGYNLTYTQIRKELFTTVTPVSDCLICWISTTKVTSATSGAVTVSSGGSGSNLSVYTVTGLHASALGSAAVRQSGGLSEQASAVPSINFDTGVALTDSGCIGAIGVGDATPALTAPASWSEGSDTGYTTGDDTGIETVYRDSGHTSQTVAWQTASASTTWAGIILELKGSVTNTDRCSGTITVSGTLGETYTPPGPTDTSVGEVSLESGSTPEARTGHQLGFRARKTSGTGTVTLRAALYEGTDNRSGDLESSALTTSLAEYALAISEANATNITSYSNLGVRFWGYSSTGATVDVEISEIWLEIPAAAAISNTDKPSGTITVSGTRSESHASTAVRSGIVTLGGTVDESTAYEDASSGTILISGTVSESWQKLYTDRCSGQIDISGTRSESNSRTVESTGTVTVSGTLGETYTAPGPTNTDRCSGTITVSGTRRESQSRVSKSTGLITISGTLSEAWSLTYTDRRSGQIDVSGTRREESSQTALSSGTVLVSGTVSEQYIGPTTDRRSGTIDVLGTRRESNSRTVERTGTINVTGTVSESWSVSGGSQTHQVSGTVDLLGTRRESQSRTVERSGEILVSGTVSESYGILNTDRATGTISVSGTQRESSSQTAISTGQVSVSGTLSEQYAGAITDRRSGIIEITGTRRESWYWTATDRLTGTVTVSGQISELYQPSGVTTDKLTGTITVSGAVVELHSRWDWIDGERWPMDSESRWGQDVGERWEVDPVA